MTCDMPLNLASYCEPARVVGVGCAEGLGDDTEVHKEGSYVDRKP